MRILIVLCSTLQTSCVDSGIINKFRKVSAFDSEQLQRFIELNNLTGVKHHNSIAINYRIEPVSDDQHCAVGEFVSYRFLNQLIRSERRAN